MTEHTLQTLGEAWAVFDRHGITHPDRPLDDSTFSVARVIIKLEEQRDDLLEACKMMLIDWRGTCREYNVPDDEMVAVENVLKVAIAKATQ